MYQIRNYHPNDKEQIKKICKLTADSKFQGSKRKLNAIIYIYCDYYLKYEPENVFVAVDEDNIPVGYCLCCSNYNLFSKKMLTEYLIKTIKAYPPYIALLLSSLLSVNILNKKYKTHLHIDILSDAQRKGLGKMLIDSLCQHLKNKNFKFVSVCTINKKSNGFKFYSKYGFLELHNYSKNIVTMTYKIK